MKIEISPNILMAAIEDALSDALGPLPDSLEDDLSPYDFIHFDEELL